ncbi:MAG TPA: hypothetical protein VEV81_03835 [Pyrinomonadaceae bacterium]|nr:hypothetical protein [Pyrinomonadaceae bacterium]
MAEKKATAVAASTDKEPSKAALQRRMEKAREDISETVEEIKDTVVGKYESVKETVAETLDWREQFRKHAVVWSLGALAVGFVVGNGIAASLEDTAPKTRGRKREGLMGEIYAVAENLSDEFSAVTHQILLPALAKKIKDKFGIDVSDKLAGLMSSPRSSKHTATKKSAAKRSATKKAGAQKRVAARKSAKKSSK